MLIICNLSYAAKCDPEALVKTVELTVNEKKDMRKAYLEYIEKDLSSLHVSTEFKDKFFFGDSKEFTLGKILEEIYNEAKLVKQNLAEQVYKQYSAAKNKKALGVICKEIEKIEINPKYPFAKNKVILYGDDELTKKWGITFTEFNDIRSNFLQEKITLEQDWNNMKWLYTCRLDFSKKDILLLEDEPDSCGELRSSVMICLAPNFSTHVSTLKRVRGKGKLALERVYTDSKKKKGSVLSCPSPAGSIKNKKSLKIVRKQSTREEQKSRPLHSNNRKKDLLVPMKGSFSGEITNDLTKEKIIGAKLLFEQLPGQVSAQQGVYDFNKVSLIHQGKDVHVSYTNFYEPNKSNISYIKPEDQTPGYDVALVPKKTNLRGHVYDSDGQPITSEVINLTVKYRLDTGEIFNKTFIAKTNESGEYSINNIYAIYHIVDADQSTNAFDSKHGIDFEMDPDAQWNNLDVTLNMNHTILKGKILDIKTKEPVSNVSVALKGISKSDGSEYVVTTDDSGSYEIKLNEHPVLSIPSKTKLELVANENKASDRRYWSGESEEVILNNNDAGIDKDDRSEYTKKNKILMHSVNNKNLILDTFLKDVEGKIYHKQTMKPLENVQVSLRQLSTGNIRKVRTDKKGFYRFRFLDAGEYEVSSSHRDGEKVYDPDKKVVTIDHESDQIVNLKLSKKDIYGYATDGKTGRRLSDVDIELNFNGVRKTARTDAKGYYYIHSVKSGRNKVVGSKLEFITNDQEVSIEDASIRLDIPLVKIKQTRDRLVVVLQWDAAPKDLDSQLLTDKHHLYYKKLSSGFNSLDAAGFNAKLDTDNTTGFGPETVTIKLKENSRETFSGQKYSYLVYKYSSERKKLKDSNGKISIFSNGERIKEFRVDQVSDSDSRLWHGFDINPDGTIVEINDFKYREQYDEIGRLQDRNEFLKDKESKMREKKNNEKSDLGEISKVEKQKIEVEDYLELALGITDVEKFIRSGDKSLDLNLYNKSKMKLLTAQISELENIRDNYNPNQKVTLEQEIEDLKEQAKILKENQSQWSDDERSEYKFLLEDIKWTEFTYANLDSARLDDGIEEMKQERQEVKIQLKSYLETYPEIAREYKTLFAKLSPEDKEIFQKFDLMVKAMDKEKKGNIKKVRALEEEVNQSLRRYR